MIRRFLWLFVFVFMSFFLTGCKQSTITIMHNSIIPGFQTSIAEAQMPKSIVKKSSGIIIYKDISSSGEVDNFGIIHFGPRDVNFDLPSHLR